MDIGYYEKQMPKARRLDIETNLLASSVYGNKRVYKGSKSHG
jgi:hypothetical protein